MIGDILIVTDDGGVVYDSSGKYYDKPFPYLDRLNSTGDGSFQDRDYMINTLGNAEFGYSVVGMIYKPDLYRDVNALNWFILATTLACIILILAFTALSTKRFSRRVGNINNTLIEIQKGKLDAKAQTKGESDEIGQIAYNLNLLSEKLNDYIKREYVAAQDQYIKGLDAFKIDDIFNYWMSVGQKQETDLAPIYAMLK